MKIVFIQNTRGRWVISTLHHHSHKIIQSTYPSTRHPLAANHRQRTFVRAILFSFSKRKVVLLGVTKKGSWFEPGSNRDCLQVIVIQESGNHTEKRRGGSLQQKTVVTLGMDRGRKHNGTGRDEVR